MSELYFGNRNQAKKPIHHKQLQEPKELQDARTGEKICNNRTTRRKSKTSSTEQQVLFWNKIH